MCVCLPPPGPALVDTSDWLTDILAMLPSVWVLTLYIHDQWSMIPCYLIHDLWFHVLWYFIHLTASLSLGTDTLHVLWSMINGLWFHLTGSLSLPWSMVPHPSNSISLGTDYLHPYSIFLDSCDWWMSDFYDYHVSLSGSKGTNTLHPWSMN